MTLLGHGVHITPPQPIEEAIAWHTVPAQLSALRKQLRDAETSRQALASAVDEHLEKLKWEFTVWLKTLQKQSAEEASVLGGRLDSLEQAGQAQFLALQERLEERLERLSQDFVAGLEASQQQLTEMIVQLDKRSELTGKARFEALKGQVTWGIADAQRSAAVLDDRIHQLEQAPLKRFWRWLTRRKNGSTL